MMYIHNNNEIDKRINVSKIANNISTLGDNSTAVGCNSRLITVLVVVEFVPTVVQQLTRFRLISRAFCFKRYQFVTLT